MLCAAFAFFVVSHVRQASATYDETAHLPAGYSYWLWGDYRLNPEHPPLVKRLAALPLLALEVRPSRTEIEWADPQTDPLSLRRIKLAWAIGLADVDAQWMFGHQLLYAIQDSTLRRLHLPDPLTVPTTARLTRADFVNDADKILFWGRMPVLALGLLLGVLIFCWGWELFGPAGGLFALTLFCFDPNFIAHSGLVTTDVGVTLFVFGAVYCLWRACTRLNTWNVIGTLLFFALAFATKFTSLLLLPMFALAGVGRVASTGDWPVGDSGRWQLSTRLSKALALGGLLAACMAAAYVLLWTVYGFRYSAAPDPARAARVEAAVWGGEPAPSASNFGRQPGHLPIEWAVRRAAATQSLLKVWPQGVPGREIERALPNVRVGLSGRLLLFAQRHRLLPEAYLYGLAHAQMKSLMRGSFLMGEYSNRGFWNYFLWTFVLKTPLATLAAIGLGLYVAIKRREPWRSRLAFLLVPVAVYYAVSLNSSLNIGHRHLLPVYPFLFVLTGGLGREWASWRSGDGRRSRRPSKRLLAAGGTVAAVVLGSLVVFAPPWRPALVYPHYLAYFNELAGGPRNGYKRLVDSNLDWGQDLKRLAEWARKNNIQDPINLCYFGMADPRYHGVVSINMPGGYWLAPQRPFDSARLPGYVAISATNLQGVYYAPEGRAQWRKFLRGATYIDAIGYSIFIYWVKPPP